MTIVTLKHEGLEWSQGIQDPKHMKKQIPEKRRTRDTYETCSLEVGMIRGQDGGRYVMYRGVKSKIHHASQQICTFYSHVLRNIISAICEESRIAGLRNEKKLSSGWSLILFYIFASDLLCTLLFLCKR